MGLPGELGQVNFLSSVERSPAGKLGTAQEPFLKTKSHNWARLCPWERNCHKMRGRKGPFLTVSAILRLSESAVPEGSTISRSWHQRRFLSWATSVLEPTSAGLPCPARKEAVPVLQPTCSMPGTLGRPLLSSWGLCGVANLRKVQPKGPRGPHNQCWCCQHSPLPVNTGLGSEDKISMTNKIEVDTEHIRMSFASGGLQNLFVQQH